MERKYKLMVLVIISLAALLAAFDFFSRNAPSQETIRLTSRTPTPSPPEINTSLNLTPIPTLPTRQISPPPLINAPPTVTGELISRLPYSTKDFAIEYFPVTNQLEVTIYSTNSSQAEKGVYDWLQEEGIIHPESLDILWSKNSHFSP